jgi:Tol biopolymer transport system component
MIRTIRIVGTRRAIILLAAMMAAFVLTISLAPVEPAAQTTSSIGKIAYVGFDTETNKQDVYTMNADGSGVTNLTKRYTDPNWSPLGNVDGSPEWSPDGTKITFTGTGLSDIGSCCSRNVYIMDADGANLKRLTNSPSTSEGEDTQASWAPDGSWLAFVSTRSDPYDDRDIYRMDADGTNQRQLTTVDPASEEPPARVTDEQPSISPDGTKIAFASNTHWDDPTSGSYHVDELDIYVMNADGTGEPERLTSDAKFAYPLEQQSRNPTWSPDGSRIAYESTRDGNSDIYVMNADGSGEPVNVSQSPYRDSDPAWSPDGTQITFTSNRDGQDDIWAVDAPPTSPSAPVALVTLFLSADAAWAASEPRNLTPGRGVEARSPDWGNAAPNTPPHIGGKLLPADRAITTDATPVIGAKVTDAETALTKRNVAIRLDDATVDRARLVYNPDTLRVRYIPGTDLSTGSHTVRVVARDPQGLVARKSWSFSVAQP